MATAPTMSIATLSFLAFIAGVTTGVHAALAILTFCAGELRPCFAALASNESLDGLTAVQELGCVIAFMVLVALEPAVAHVTLLYIIATVCIAMMVGLTTEI